MNTRCLRRLVAGLAFACHIAGAQELSSEDLLRGIESNMRAGKRADALGLADALIARDPKNAKSYFTRARVHEDSGQHEKAVADYSRSLELDPNTAPPYQQRGLVLFKLDRVEEAIADFDKYLARQPKQAFFHWQRGIALFEAGRFSEGREQFEKHQHVNTQDVENAAWHFLCRARETSFKAAGDSLLPIKNDTRVPMMEVYALFQGKGTIEAVFDAVGKNAPGGREKNQRLFYANFYAGLYLEAKEQPHEAWKHVTRALETAEGMDYMSDVARIHAKRLKARLLSGSPAPGKN